MENQRRFGISEPTSVAFDFSFDSDVTSCQHAVGTSDPCPRSELTTGFFRATALILVIQIDLTTVGSKTLYPTLAWAVDLSEVATAEPLRKTSGPQPGRRVGQLKSRPRLQMPA
jgi:hypothetical protein